mmetsp:Transcript_6188/g.10258  ORF Transcript_6188/g.10258 Transcript_6188/m.10258 type:complete len:351 (+) Transcript_6188:111-1163(+)
MILEWEGKRYDLADAHLSIGRQFKNDIVIRGKLISRTHCEIENGKILDRSTNGTFVNNKPLLPDIQTDLRPGDIIQMGNVKLRVKENTSSDEGGNSYEGSMSSQDNDLVHQFNFEEGNSLFSADVKDSVKIKRKKVSNRAARACVFCHTSKVRCNPNTLTGNRNPCQRCFENGVHKTSCVPYVPPKKLFAPNGQAARIRRPKALADNLNKHQGIPCIRNPRCLRPFKHPGHCRTRERTQMQREHLRKRKRLKHSQDAPRYATTSAQLRNLSKLSKTSSQITGQSSISISKCYSQLSSSSELVYHSRSPSPKTPKSKQQTSRLAKSIEDDSTVSSIDGAALLLLAIEASRT